MARYETANQIINDTALEVGLVPVTDVYASIDESFVQLRGLLNSGGRQLVEMWEWEILTRKWAFTTEEGDTGKYDLPEDFSRFINQTGWDRGNRVPIGGPLSAQDWTYLEGRDLISQSIYASFRVTENQMWLFPQPPPVDLSVNFEYISRNWVREDNTEKTLKDQAQASTDTILFSPALIVAYLKVKFLSAKGMDYTAAASELENQWANITGTDKGAPILSASNRGAGFPYLDIYRNSADTGYGG